MNESLNLEPNANAIFVHPILGYRRALLWIKTNLFQIWGSVLGKLCFRDISNKYTENQNYILLQCLLFVLLKKRREERKTIRMKKKTMCC